LVGLEYTAWRTLVVEAGGYASETHLRIELTSYSLDDVFYGVINHMSGLEYFVFVEQVRWLMDGLQSSLLAYPRSEYEDRRTCSGRKYQQTETMCL
jgi:hypothetical protein